MLARLEYEPIKVLLHFDYPYFGEPGDGLKDEIGSVTWAKIGTVPFVGTEQPVNSVIPGTPKFGYRCPSFNSTVTNYLQGTHTSLFRFNGTKSYDIEFFCRPTVNNHIGAIVQFVNPSNSPVFDVNIQNLKIRVNSSTFGFNTSNIAETSTDLTVNQFNHVLVRIHESKLKIYIDGIERCTKDIPTPNTSLDCSTIRLGTSFVGQIDEFLIREFDRNPPPAGNPVVPIVKYDPIHKVSTGEDTVLVKGLGLYHYDPSCTDPADGEVCIMSENGVGRWLLVLPALDWLFSLSRREYKNIDLRHELLNDDLQRRVALLEQPDSNALPYRLVHAHYSLNIPTSGTWNGATIDTVIHPSSNPLFFLIPVPNLAKEDLIYSHFYSPNTIYERNALYTYSYFSPGVMKVKFHRNQTAYQVSGGTLIINVIHKVLI